MSIDDRCFHACCTSATGARSIAGQFAILAASGFFSSQILQTQEMCIRNQKFPVQHDGHSNRVCDLASPRVAMPVAERWFEEHMHWYAFEAHKKSAEQSMRCRMTVQLRFRPQ